jgi:hypothetical protein
MSTIHRAIYRKLGASANAAYNLQFTQCELWSRTYTIYVQLHILRLQYSTERICAAIGDMTTIRRALYCNLGANTAHSLLFTQCGLWSRTYTMCLQLRIFRHQYSTEYICAAMGDISTIQCALYCKHWAQHSVHHPVYAMCTVVPNMYKLFTAPHSQATIFN